MSHNLRKNLARKRLIAKQKNRMRFLGQELLSMILDPIDTDPAYRDILKIVDAQLEKTFDGMSRDLGFCYLYWETRKNLLLGSFGIRWRSPAELNPNILFD